MKLKIDGWKQHITFSACHFITNHEKCSRLHGHTYGVHLELSGGLGEDCIVVDFTDIKKHLKGLLQHLDHRVLIPTRRKDAVIEREGGEVQFMVGNKRYVLPGEDVVLLDIPSASAEHVARYLGEKMGEYLRNFENVHAFSLGVDEGPGQGAWFSETFG